MSARLFVRLERDAAVTGVSSPWILRDAHGNELDRGSAMPSTLPKASEIIGLIAHDGIVIRTVQLPPGRRARTPVALAAAMEPYLLSDARTNYILLLAEARDGNSVLAALARGWIDACLAAFAAAGRPIDRLVSETSLPARSRDVGVAVCLPQGGFLRLADEVAIGLDGTLNGNIPLSLSAQFECDAGRRPERLRVYQDTPLATEHWQQVLGLPIEAAGRWDWAAATNTTPLHALPDLLGAIRRQGTDKKATVRRFRIPAALAAGILLAHMAATVVHWALGARERALLNAQVRAAFRNSVSPSEPLVDAVLQTRRALGVAQRNSGQYAKSDLTYLLGRFAAELSAAPAGRVHSITFSTGALELELDAVPPARLERLLEQLRSHGIKAESRASGARLQLKLQAEQ